MVTITIADALTHTEANVLSLVEAGHSNQMIAETLAITVGTVKSHLHRVYEKLDARNRLDAISKARMRGYFPIPAETLGACKTQLSIDAAADPHAYIGHPASGNPDA